MRDERTLNVHFTSLHRSAGHSRWGHVELDLRALQTCGASLRSLFVEILMNCEPQKPDELWAEFKREGLLSESAHTPA